jgi:hypothetical protein
MGHDNETRMKGLPVNTIDHVGNLGINLNVLPKHCPLAPVGLPQDVTWRRTLVASEIRANVTLPVSSNTDNFGPNLKGSLKILGVSSISRDLSTARITSNAGPSKTYSDTALS